MKDTNRACNENISYPLIYRFTMPSHILIEILSFSLCFSDIIIKFSIYIVRFLDKINVKKIAKE